MFQIFYPYEYIESVFSIDYKKLYSKGYRGIIFDIDNTLVHHGEDSTEEVDALFQVIHDVGLKTLLLSDNSKARIQRFLKNIDSLYIHDAQKPKVESYLKAVEMLGIKKHEAVFIGDQIFRDILGANRSGIDSILVKYLRYDDETKIGISRNLEKVVLKFYEWDKSCQNRIGDILNKEGNYAIQKKRKKLFCEIHPLCFAISLKKENCKRHLKNILNKEKFAKTIKKETLPVVISKQKSYLIKKGKGIDPILQENKVTNIALACRKINGMIIRPGETFSFWKIVGSTTKRKGYKDGRVIEKNVVKAGTGGGLCNLGNTIHLLVLDSPLKVTEVHYHSDALAPEQGKRVPMSTGTSICYNHIDFRFKNETDQNVQLIIEVKNRTLYAQLRSEKLFPYQYELIEENHHFKKEKDKFYRNSKIYRLIYDRTKKNVLGKELIRDNHSEVMFDYALIPEDLIRE